MAVSMSQDIAVTRASYEICYLLGKHMKLFTAAEIINECFINASNILFDRFSNKITESILMKVGTQIEQ